MKAIWTPTSKEGVPGIVRVFESDDAVFGEPYLFFIQATIVDVGNVALIEGLQGGISTESMRAIRSEFKRVGVKYVRWHHTNKRGHRVDCCYDVQKNKLRLE